MLSRKSRATRGCASEMIPSSSAILPKSDGVLMLQRCAAAGEIFEHAIEFFAFQFAKRKRAPHDRESLLDCDRSERGHADDVLRENVVRLFQNLDRVERALPDEMRGRSRFYEIVDVGRDEHAVAAVVQGMSGAADALDGARNAFRRRHHHDEIDRADIDPQFEAGRANDRAQFAIFEPVLDLEPHTAIERGVMHFDLVREFGQQFL